MWFVRCCSVLYDRFPCKTKPKQNKQSKTKQNKTKTKPKQTKQNKNTNKSKTNKAKNKTKHAQLVTSIHCYVVLLYLVILIINFFSQSSCMYQ